MANPSGYFDRDRKNIDWADGTRNTITGGESAGTMNHPYSHVGNTSEYLASGYPFFTQIQTATTVSFNGGVAEALTNGDVISMEFPYVTRWIMIKAYKNNAEVAHSIAYVAPSQTGVGTGTGSALGVCKADLAMVSGVRLEMKCAKLYFRYADVAEITHIQVIAGLTNIPAADFVVETPSDTNIGVDKIATIVGVVNAS